VCCCVTYASLHTSDFRPTGGLFNSVSHAIFQKYSFSDVAVRPGLSREVKEFRGQSIPKCCKHIILFDALVSQPLANCVPLIASHESLIRWNVRKRLLY